MNLKELPDEGCQTLQGVADSEAVTSSGNQERMCPLCAAGLHTGRLQRTSLLTAALLYICTLPALAAPLRILCIGDSITQGGRLDTEYTYRLPLQQMLKGMGREVDFIGTQTKGLDGLKWPQGFDPDHEGYYGQTTEAVRIHLAANLPKLPAPDIALINLGTNDGWDTRTPLRGIVKLLRESNPKVAVYIANPRVGGLRGIWLAHSLKGVANTLSTAESPVAFVSAPSGWGTADTFDGAHPNTRGQVRQAAQWVSAMAMGSP